MTYAVAGASGNTGAVVANTLLDRGKKVRVIVRDAAKGEPFAARGAEVAVADLEDADALRRAFTGAEGAFVLTPPNMSTRDFRAYQRRIADAVASAAEATRLPHLVLLSSMGAQLPEGTGPIAGVHAAEQRFRALSATRSTFVRAGYFMENFGGSLATLGQGFIQTFLPADKKLDMIATRDIGTTIAIALAEGARETTVIELGGPPYSPNDAAAILTKLVGAPIRVQEAPLAAVAPTFESFGMTPELAALYSEMVGAIASGRVAFEGGHRRIEGTTSLETVLAKLLGR